MADTENARLIERLGEVYAQKTEAEINKVKKEKCSKCKYKAYVNGAGGSKTSLGSLYCNWADLTGHKFRDCLPEECKYFEPGRRRRKPPRSIDVRKKATP